MTHEWLLIAGMAAVTFSVRYSLIGLSGRIKLPPAVVSALHFVPPSVFTAIIVPYVVFPSGQLSVNFENAYLVGAVATVLIGFWKRNLLLTIGIGMGFFGLYQMLLNAY